MAVPSDFGQLPVGEQLLVAIDVERVARGLAPFQGLTVSLDRDALAAAERGRLPASPGKGYGPADTEWLGGADNALDVDYEWVYEDGPGSGLAGCSKKHSAGCWVDRQIVFDRFAGATDLVMGAAIDPTADRSPGDRGGTSIAAVFAVAHGAPSALVYSWVQAQAAIAAGTLRPLTGIGAHESPTGIPDPPQNVNPVPDYFDVCAQTGVDTSSRCTDAVVAAIDRARALEGVGPMVLPTDFARLSTPEQLFVAVNLERIARGLAPFVGMTAALDANARRGADTANDPPSPGNSYLLVDSEWAGGAVNALDAVYGWMYDDGWDSGNLDCPRPTSPGCWGHRHGILDDFGSGAHLVAGAALDLHGDTNRGDRGGTSMAVTLAVASGPERFVYTWADALAHLPPG